MVIFWICFPKQNDLLFSINDEFNNKIQTTLSFKKNNNKNFTQKKYKNNEDNEFLNFNNLHESVNLNTFPSLIIF